MMMKTFRTRCRAEEDEWSAEGKSITEDAALEVIQQGLDRGPIVVEHWHYRGGSAPSRQIFEDWEDFESYLGSAAVAGDAIDVWSFADICTPERRIAGGKCPADDGTMPKGGSY